MPAPNYHWFFDITISQPTQLRCGGMFSNYITINLLTYLTAKNFETRFD